MYDKKEEKLYMNTIYVTPSARESRRAIHWLQEHDIPFTERNLFSAPLSEKEKKELQEQTHGQWKDLLRPLLLQESTLPQIISGEKKESDSLLSLLTNNPYLLQAPLLVGESKWILGFDEEQYQRVFGTQKVD